MSSSISSRHSDVVSMLIVGASKSARAMIAPHLGAYPTTLLEQLVEHRCSVRPLRAREGYRDASTAMRRLGVDVDAWPVPPAGLFGDVLQGLHDMRVRCKTATSIGVHRKKSGRLCRDSEASRNTRGVVVFSRKSRPDRVSRLSCAGPDRDLHATAFRRPLQSRAAILKTCPIARSLRNRIRTGRSRAALRSRGSKSYTLRQNDRESKDLRLTG